MLSPSLLWLAIAVLPAWLGWRLLSPLYSSPLQSLRGPPAPSLFLGNFRQISTVRNSALMQQWIALYGPSFLIRWFGMTPSLWTVDPATVAHVLSNTYDYGKPLEGRKHTARLIGKSILVMEGEAHRKQRRVLNPAFGTSQIRELHQIFMDKSSDLRDLWKAAISSQGGCARMNVIDDLSSATLEIIGLAGFDYQLGALVPGGEPNELNLAFRAIFKKPPSLSLARVIMDVFSIFDFFPDERTKRLKEARVITNRIGMQLVQERKAMILSESGETPETLEKKSVNGRDLLTLLMRANMATDIPDHQRLSDEEVLAQIPTLLAAGHETTSTALTWCLFALTGAPQVQAKLRRELLGVSSEYPSPEELSALPYLDAVVRETLRLYPSVTTALRVAMHDDVLPVSQPFKDRYGRLQHEIRIAKGNRVVIPIMGMNQSRLLWGDDALEFRPERWESPPKEIERIPGMWGNTLTFSAGIRGCIGYRFAVNEMKAILFTLVRAFQFELDVESSDVERTGTFLQRPSLLSDPDKGAQLPLRVRDYVTA